MKKSPDDLALDHEYMRGQLDSIYKIAEMIKNNDYTLLDKHVWYKKVLSMKPIKREDR